MNYQKIQYFKLRQTLDNVPTSEDILSLQGKYKTLSTLDWILDVISTLELSINDVYHCQGIVLIDVEKCKKEFNINRLNTKNGKTTRINHKIKEKLTCILGLNKGNKGYSFTTLKQKDPEIYKEYCCKDYTDLTYISGDKAKMLKHRQMYYTRQEVKNKIKNNKQKETRQRREQIIENYKKNNSKNSFNSKLFIQTLINYYQSSNFTVSRNLINCHYDDILRLHAESFRKVITQRICDACDLSYNPLIANVKCQLTTNMLSIQDVITKYGKDELDENWNESP